MRNVISLVLAGALLALAGCKGEDDGGTAKDENQAGQGATETNVAPAPCKDDDDCPEGIACAFPEQGGDIGFCDVNEMVTGEDSGPVVSTGAPALCNDAGDCPPGIECKSWSAAGGPGYCAVDEMVVEP